MNYSRVLFYAWVLLISLTLISVLLAETKNFNNISATLVCFVISVKGHVVVDTLMGLKHAHASIRKVMLSYMYIIPALILLGIWFPSTIKDLTTLG
jgi:hypothetical protein